MSSAEAEKPNKL